MSEWLWKGPLLFFGFMFATMAALIFAMWVWHFVIQWGLLPFP